MELTNLRRLSMFVVAGNLAALLIAAVALPKELHGVLPVIALMLPLLSTAVIEALAERGPRSDNELPRAAAARLSSLRHVTVNGRA